MNVSRGALTTFLVLALLLSEDPLAAATVEFETGSYKALVGVELDTAGTLQLTRKMDDGGARTRGLPASLRHVVDVREAYSKLLIVGRTNQLNDLIVIYALPSIELLDVILCRDLALSPSGRFVVFERFFPRSAPAHHLRHMTLLYDVRATPQQNRLGGESVPDFESGSRSIDAGYPIYPERTPDESRPYLVPATAERVVKDRDHTPPYAWSDDERRVAFLVHPAESSGESKLVVVGIGQDGRPVSQAAIGVAHDFDPPFIELGFVGGSIRLVKGNDHRKLIRMISRD